MKSIHLRESPKQRGSSTFASFLLVIMLVACGKSPVTIPSSAKPSPSNTTNQLIKTPATTSSSSDLHLNGSQITVDRGNLRIQSKVGFQCPYYQIGVPTDQLVLASDRMTYTQDEIKQMGDYVGGNTSAASLLQGGKVPPPTLRWVLGGSMHPIPGTMGDGPGTSNSVYSACGGTLTLTNTGSTPIQIPRVNIRLEERPQQNSYQYRLIDACSVMPQSYIAVYSCIPSQGNNSRCKLYTASIRLGLGGQNTVFSATPSTPGCGTLTLAPADQIDLTFDFSLSSNIPQNLIYSILPILIVDTDRGEQALSILQLASTLAFASANQFSCYRLKGTTFVLEQSPVFSEKLWCM